MDHLVDLDVLAQRLGALRDDWGRWAKVGDFTWRDEVPDWPKLISPDRTAVKLPESLGIHLVRDADEFEAVVWTGGWADIVFTLDGEVKNLYAEFGGVDGAYAAVARNVEDFFA